MIGLPPVLRCASTVDGRRCQKPRCHGSWHVHKDGPTTSTWGRHADKRETYETVAPWITWTWLSFDRETRITGRSRFQLTCCICGERETIRVRIPRFGAVPTPPGGVHPERLRAIDRHAHPGLQDPKDWALPLRNPAAWSGGLPLDVFENVAHTAVLEQQAREEEP